MGELNDDEQNRLEVSYLADEDLFEELLLVEDELIDSYARDEFLEHERKRIEKHFLRSRTRREKVMFIQLLLKYSAAHSDNVKVKRPSRWRDMISFFSIRV